MTHSVLLLLLYHCKGGEVVSEAIYNLLRPAVTSFDRVSGPAPVSIVVEDTARSYCYAVLQR